MMKNDKLGGKIELVDDSIFWRFEDVFYNICISEYDTYFSVNKTNKQGSQITHWHPDLFEIYNQVCLIGEVGNVLVIKGRSVLYMGPKDKCKYNKTSRIYFFEAK